MFIKTKFYLLIVLFCAVTMQNANAQWFETGNYATIGDFIGTLNSEPFPIYTDGDERMRVDAIGNVGIGTTVPSFLLDVNLGNINLNQTSATTSEAYRIGGNRVLWHNNNTSNIFVGVGAGASNINTSGSDNTFVGSSAGYSNTSGIQNTFIGYNAGYTGQGAQYSTFVGYYAGYYATGRWNTFTGYYAGWYNTTGEHNCFYGKKSGQHNRVGEGNTFYGDHSGWRVGENYGSSGQYGNYNVFMGDATGSNFFGGDSNVIIGTHGGAAIGNGTNHHGNIFIGAYAGQTTTGHDNILVGVNANSSANVKNAIAIGTTANVTASNQMILGDNSIQVGIGLSGNAVAGTNTKLEINAPVSDWSGLRFRQLTSFSSPAGSNPGPGVLSVDENGDVIYVPDNGGGGNVSACGTPSTDYLTKWSPSPNDICNSIVFEDDTRRIGISTTSPFAKFEVNNIDFEQIGALAYTSRLSSTRNWGMFGSAQRSTLQNIGIRGQAVAPNSVLFNNTASIFGTSAMPSNIGVMGLAQGQTWNIGGAFMANEQFCGRQNIGVYASARNSCPSGFVDMAGFFNGNVIVTGRFIPVSDGNLKDSITNITNGLSILSQLQPKHFVFKTDSFPYMNLPWGGQLGFIAQQVDSVLPEVVSSMIQPAISDSSGTILMDTFTFKGINYINLIPLTIAAIQEQQTIIDSLAATKVSANTNPTDSNRLTKWSAVNNVLSNSLLYDDGSRMGLPATQPGVYFNIQNHNDSVALHITSHSTNTANVLKASYSANGNTQVVAAVYGYSKYTNSGSDDDGLGGRFEGGRGGLYALGNGSNDIQIGVMGESKNSDDMNVGVMGKAVENTTGVNAGVYAVAESADVINVGVISESNSSNSGSINAGVMSSASGSDYQNVGGVFQALDSVGTRYGIYAEAHSLTSGPLAYAGYFDGDVHATGTVTWTSDAALKQNITDLNSRDALSTILQLQPKTYEYRTNDYAYLGLPRGLQYGLLAHEVEQVYPNLVSDIVHPEIKGKDGQQLSPRMEYKGLNYVGLVPVLISALKQQESKIDSLNNIIETRLSDLEERLNYCCGRGSSGKQESDTQADGAAQRMSIQLSSMQVIVLEQNVPNPFAEQTSISYFIPEGTGEAQIVFTDMLGTVIKKADLQAGYGVMTVFASSLSSGQYSYTLLVDGKPIETKKMVKAK